MSTPTLVQPRPTLEDLLQQTTRQWHGYIANKDDAITVGQNIILSGHIGPDQGEGEEYDYPMTPEDESELVRILYEAMCDFSDPFEERNGKTSFQVERLKMVSDLQMEVVAWDVLVAIEGAYCGYHGYRKCNGDIKYQKFGTFGAHFRAVVNACREYKSLVYNLLAPNPAFKLASHPLAQVGMKKTNSVINGGRAEEKSRGKEALEKLGQAGPPGTRSLAAGLKRSNGPRRREIVPLPSNKRLLARPKYQLVP